jgi:D-ribose pyranose/furanose isomerase RbsD
MAWEFCQWLVSGSLNPYPNVALGSGVDDEFVENLKL